MADYRKALSKEEIPAAFRDIYGDRSEKPLSVEAADTAVSVTTPIDSIIEIQEELKKDDPDYLKIGMLGGIEAISLVPGIAPAARTMIRKGADMARQTDEVVEGVSNIPKVARSAKEPFKKTRPAYRIATQSKDGKLYPLFVNADDEIPVGTWVDAKMPPIMFRGANGNMYAPSKGAKREPDRFYLDGQEITKKEYNKLGPNSKPYAKVVRGEKEKPTGDLQVIPDEETAEALKKAGFQVEKPSKAAPFGKVRSVAARPGFHATTKPVAHHLGPEDLVVSEEEVQTLLKAGITPKAFKHKTFRKLDGKTISKDAYKKLSPEDKARVEETKKYYVKRRAEDQVFVEVDMADDTSEDLAAYMKERGRTDINDKLPEGGSYSYVDGQADGETWVVGGNMRVNRVLSREEAKAAQEAAGVKDLPYRDEVEAILGREFAKGGLVGEDMYQGVDDYQLAEMGADMEKPNPVSNQMGLMFKSSRTGYAEGGMTQEIDPVSGNEVPIGSMPEEVRDDIPAQLSEGEYVVPADVVRYYGVKFFEDLRNDAKAGWQSMEANGRIGGEPIEPEGMETVEPEDDDFPFDISELQTVDAFEGAYVSGYAEGGDTRNTPMSISKKETIDYGATSGGGTSGSSYFDVRKYVNAEGKVQYITFMNGQPINVIPEGFYPEGELPEQDETETAATVDRSGDDDGGPDVQPSESKPWYESYDLKSKEGIQNAINDLTADSNPMADTFLGTMFGPLGSAATGLITANNLAKAKGIVEQVKQTDADFAAQLEEQINKRMEDTVVASTIENISPTLIDGSTYSEELSGMVSTTAATTKEQQESDDGSKPDPAVVQTQAIVDAAAKDAVVKASTPQPSASETPTTTPESSDDRTDALEIHKKTMEKQKQQAAQAAETAPEASAKVIEKAKAKGQTEEQVKEIESEAERVQNVLEDRAQGVQRGFAKGGLMKRKKK